MTKFALGLSALSIALLAPLAAHANNNSGANYGCSFDVINCVIGANQVGKSVTSYSLGTGNGKSESSAVDQFKMQPGDKPIVKILKSDPLLAQSNEHNASAHLDF